MSRTRIAVMVLALGSWTSAAARAQCPAVSSPLQAAIDAAQPGDVILIPDAGSNLGCTVCVTKPLTFIGNSAVGPVTIEASSNAMVGCFSAGCTYTAPTGVFYIAPGVVGDVVFHNLRIVGKTCYSTPAAVMRGIYCAAPDATVVIDHCEVEGGDYPFAFPGDAFADGATGIQGLLARLVALESTIRGGDGFFLSNSIGGAAGNGGHGADVSGEVVLARSLLFGGNGGNSFGLLFGGGFCGMPAPGSGGSAALTPTLHAYQSFGLGGLGGVQFDCAMQPVGVGPDGQGFSGTAPAPLHRPGTQPQPGGTAVLTLQNPASLPAVVAASLSGWSPGVVLPGHGAYFLGPAPVLLAFGLGVTAVAVPLPADPALAGASFPIQAAIGGPLTFQTTNPEVVVVRP